MNFLTVPNTSIHYVCVWLFCVIFGRKQVIVKLQSHHSIANLRVLYQTIMAVSKVGSDHSFTFLGVLV